MPPNPDPGQVSGNANCLLLMTTLGESVAKPARGVLPEKAVQTLGLTAGRTGESVLSVVRFTKVKKV